MDIKSLLQGKVPLLDDVVYFIPKNINTVEDYEKQLIYDNLNKKNTEIESQPNKNQSIEDFSLETEESNIEFLSMDDYEDSAISDVDFTNFISIGEDNEKDDTSSDSDSTVEMPEIQYVSCANFDYNNLQLEEINISTDTEEVLTVNNDKEDDNSMDLSSLTTDTIDDLSILSTDEINVGYIITTTQQDDILSESIKVVENEGNLDEEIDFINKINSINLMSDEDDFSDFLGKINLKEFKKNEKKFNSDFN